MSSSERQPEPKPTPERIMDALNAYQRTAAVKSAIELDLFTAIGKGASAPTALASVTRASVRGLRILCDHLTVQGLLTKQDGAYSLTPDSQAFLDRRSPSCIADAAIGFFASNHMVRSFDSLTASVRKGGTAISPQGTMGPDDPIWVNFAISMAAVQAPLANGVAKILNAEAAPPWKILDVGSGHGLFGIAIARKNPKAEIYSQDWAPVLEVAQRNADDAGVSPRFHQLPGSAFDIDLGSDYDLVLLTNFLQLLDRNAIEPFLKKVHAALKPGGRSVTVGFIPNDDRISPPAPAAFSLSMLAITPGGEAYSVGDYEEMFQKAGFTSNEKVELPNSPQQLILSTK
jgi:SAM-dependent methyltransferase